MKWKPKKNNVEVWTPPEITEKMFDYIDMETMSDPSKVFLDACVGTGRLLLEALKRKLSHDHDVVQALSTLVGTDIKEENVVQCRANLLLMVSSITNKEIEQEWIDIVEKNVFVADVLTHPYDPADVIVMNPPYANMLHIKVMTKLLPLAPKLVFVHPTTYLFDIKEQMSKTYKRFKEAISDRIVSFEAVDNSLFEGCYISALTGIVVLDEKRQGKITCKFDHTFEADDVSQITKYGNNWDLVRPLYERVKAYEKLDAYKFHASSDIEIDPNKFYLQLAFVRGHGNIYKPLKTFYTFFPDDLSCMTRLKIHGRRPTFVFDTDEERQNMFAYLKTKFARFCLAFNKHTTNMGNNMFVPYPDLSVKWTDEMLYDLYDVSPELRLYIENYLDDYYVRTQHTKKSEQKLYNEIYLNRGSFRVKAFRLVSTGSLKLY